MCKRVISLVFTIIICLVMNLVNVQAVEKGKNILVICSYDTLNYWEDAVVDGLRTSLRTKDDLRIEYLDARDDENIEHTYNRNINYLNEKYKDKDIDYVITIDQEAFDFVRNNLFTENSILYKKKSLFVGLNENQKLSIEEKKYITGIINPKENDDIMDVILSSTPYTKDIYILGDGSEYCDKIYDSINNNNKYSNITLHKHIYYDLDSIDDKFKNIDHGKSVILVAGDFRDENIDLIHNSAHIISAIKRVTNAPIYTTIYNYIKDGALGGTILDGNKIGSIVGQYLSQQSEGEYNEEGNIVISRSVVKTTIVNSRSVMEYGLAQDDFPRNSVFIDKYNTNTELTLKVMLFNNIIFIIGFSIITLLCIFIYTLNKKYKVACQEKDKLIVRDKVKRDYSIILSHEVRTPLNILLNTSKLIKTYLVENESIDKSYILQRMEYIIKNSSRLLKTLNNNVDAAKIEAGVASVHFENLNIVEVIEDIITASHEYALTHNTELIFDPLEEEIITAIDKVKIERVMLNLISNSIKNINGSGHIIIGCERDEENVYITTTDNGVGMNKETREHLFEKYYQSTLKGSLRRNFEGSGLGMYITRCLISIHGGTIQVESEENIGTKFTITIPIRIVDQVDAFNSRTISNNQDDIVRIELSDLYD